MKKPELVVFFFIFSVIFLFEGLGLKGGRDLSLWLIIFLPILVFLFDFIKRKKILFPRQASRIFFLLFIIYLLSSVFSINKSNSFQYLLLYISLFLIFIFAQNYKEMVKKALILSIFAFSYLFSIYSLFSSYLINKWPILTIYSSYNLVSAGLRAHNQLGNFLVLPLTISFYFLLTKTSRLVKKASYFSILFFTPFLIFSYSRSAYGTLILILAILAYHLLKKRKIKTFSVPIVLLVVVFLTSSLFLVVTVSESKKIPLLSSAHDALTTTFDLKTKQFLAKRTSYFSHAVKATTENPLFGLGAGNYGYASTKYTNSPWEGSSTAHNIFLEVFSESGVFGGAFFLLIVLLILKKSKFDVFKITFLALLLNFQADYTYRIYPLILLFFIFAGLIYQEGIKADKRRTTFFLAVTLLILLNLVLLSKVFLVKENYRWSLYTNPLSNEAYEPLIDFALRKGEVREALLYARFYESVMPGTVSVLDYLSDIYLRLGEEEKALIYAKQAFSKEPFNGRNFFKKVYSLERLVNGEEKAEQFADSYLSKIESLTQEKELHSFIIEEAEKFCFEINYGECPYKFEN